MLTTAEAESRDWYARQRAYRAGKLVNVGEVFPR